MTRDLAWLTIVRDARGRVEARVLDRAWTAPASAALDVLVTVEEWLARRILAATDRMAA